MGIFYGITIILLASIISHLYRPNTFLISQVVSTHWVLVLFYTHCGFFLAKTAIQLIRLLQINP